MTDGPTLKLLCVSMGKMNRIITFRGYDLKGKNNDYRNTINRNIFSLVDVNIINAPL